jgi:dihydroxyacid dehydratase/phosphogluconate dehydratase
MNIGIVSAYNDMLSAHQPYGRYPEQMKIFAREVGATAQVAGAVPAMCDGVTQGQDSMELSLFSRDVIAMATAVGLSHGMFESVAMLGICDKIVRALQTKKNSVSVSYMQRARLAAPNCWRRKPRPIMALAHVLFTAPPIPTR